MRHLIVWCSVEDKFGNHVRGHLSRANSVVTALREITECSLSIVNVFSEHDFVRAIKFYGQEKVVCIVDNRYRDFGKWLPKRSLIITDEESVSFHIIPRYINAINPETVIKFWTSPDGYGYTAYRGVEHAIVSPVVNRYRWHGDSKEVPTVSIVPGGARDIFFDNYPEDDFIYDTHIHILENLSHEELLEECCRSKFVVCTPSVVSLEMIAMGVPFAFIQTADDQTAYVSKYLEFGGIDATDIEQLKRFVRNPQPMPKIADSKHTYKLAQHVYQMMMEK